jgi:hypothetical protein
LYRAFSINNTQGIPILENYDDLTTGNLSRRSADAVLSYIISTLDKAESLTADFTDSRGFSNLAINVLKSKVFLYKKDYASIITTFQKINTKYSLAKYPLSSSVNYIAQLNDTTDFSKFNEIIYQVGGQFASLEYGRNTNSNNNATASISGYILNDSIANLFSANDIRKTLIVKGALKRLELIRNHPEYKEQLWTIVRALQGGLKEKGFDIGHTNTMVTPVMMKGTVGEATGVVHDLRENFGIFCSVVVYPVIPKGMILLRLIPTAVHTLADVEETINAFGAIRSKLESGAYRMEQGIVAMGEQH